MGEWSVIRDIRAPYHRVVFPWFLKYKNIFPHKDLVFELCSPRIFRTSSTYNSATFYFEWPPGSCTEWRPLWQKTKRQKKKLQGLFTVSHTPQIENLWCACRTREQRRSPKNRLAKSNWRNIGDIIRGEKEICLFTEMIAWFFAIPLVAFRAHMNSQDAQCWLSTQVKFPSHCQQSPQKTLVNLFSYLCFHSPFWPCVCVT